MLPEGECRNFKWGLSAWGFALFGLFAWLGIGGFLLYCGRTTAGGLWLALSFKWVYDLLWYRHHPHLSISSAGVAVRQGPLYHPDWVEWEDIEEVESQNPGEVQLLLYDERRVTVYLAALEPVDRTAALSALRDGLRHYRIAHPGPERLALRNHKLARTYRSRAEALQRRGRFQLAIPLFDKAIDLDPGNDRAFTGRGLSLFGCGLYDEAIADYNRAIRINPVRAEAYYLKARACERARRRKDAIESYNDFLRFASTQHQAICKVVRERVQRLEESPDL